MKLIDPPDMSNNPLQLPGEEALIHKSKSCAIEAMMFTRRHRVMAFLLATAVLLGPAVKRLEGG